MGKIETQIHLNLFKPREYQKKLIDALENKGYRKILTLWPRRAGKDLTAFHCMLRAALRQVGIYYYIFPTYAQAKKALWNNITSEGMKVLDYVPPELLLKKNESELSMTFVNGSMIQLVGSSDYDKLLGTNPRGCVFSEYCVQDKNAYLYLRPILTANDGWAIFATCVAPDTIVLTEDGLARIGGISYSRERFTTLNKRVYGLGGFHNASDFHYGGKKETLKITLASGYEIECTKVHPLWNGKEWVKSADLKIGDLIPIQYGQDIWGKGLSLSDCPRPIHGAVKKRFDFNTVSSDFMYLLGLIHAEGCYDKAKCTVTNIDSEIIEFLRLYEFKTRQDGVHHELNSQELFLILEYLGFKHGAINKIFPERLFECTREQMKFFLQGIFDGDGTSNSCVYKRGTIKYVTTNKSFAQTLQVVLLNFGIASSMRKEIKQPGGIVLTRPNPKICTIYNVEISGHFAHIFYRDIGFRLQRKQQHWDNVTARCRIGSGNTYPIDPSKFIDYLLPKNIISNPYKISRKLLERLQQRKDHPYLQELLKEKLYYSPIKEIECSENETFDLVVPDTHSFFSNGFISHNTVRGHNHLWDLFQIAKDSPEWFCELLTVEDTQHIPLSEIQNEIRENIMSIELVRQEYYNDWNLGIENSFYCHYIDKLRLNGQIGPVPWEPAYPVYTAWDLGMNDSNCIIYFQVIGAVIHIIDYFEKNNQGLEYYAKVLRNNAYDYQTHFGPFDLMVREQGTGITRKQKAQQLGIDFKVLDKIPFLDGIEHVRTILPKCYIDEVKCARLIRCLENYRREFDAKRNVALDKPVHDDYSHGADAFRYLAQSIQYCGKQTSPQELERRYHETRYGTQHDLPRPFRETPY